MRRARQAPGHRLRLAASSACVFRHGWTGRGAAGGVVRVFPATAIDGYRGVERGGGDGGVQFRMSEPSQWTNLMGFVHGGVWACLAEMAASRAVAQHNPALAPARLHTIFLRPGGGDTTITAEADIARVGSTSAVVDVVGRAVGGAHPINRYPSWTTQAHADDPDYARSVKPAIALSVGIVRWLAVTADKSVPIAT